MTATFTSAYRKAGYELPNPRNSWSAKKADGSGVALTVWADEITHKSTEPWVMDIRGHARLDLWKDRVGNAIRKQHIQHALDHLGGEFDLILCRAVDANADIRKVKTAQFWERRRGYIDASEFNTDTGEFRIELHAVD